MVTTSTIAARIDQGLDALILELEDLPNVVREWDTLPEAARASVGLDWDHLLIDILSDVERRAQKHELDEEQQRRLREVYRLLENMRADLDRLGFPIPAVG
jgi:hypothetical protein